MKTFFQKLGDFLTDSNGDGDIVRVAGLALLIFGAVGWWNGKDPTIVFGIGSGLIISGKLGDAIIPKGPQGPQGLA